MSLEEQDFFDIEDSQSYKPADDIDDDEDISFDTDKLGSIKDFVVDEQTAIEIIEQYFTENILGLFGEDSVSYPRTFQALTKNLGEVLAKNKDKIKQGGKQKERRDKGRRSQVRAAARALDSFLADFCRKYIELRPTPSQPLKYKHSKGRYENSSIIYFTKDKEDSRGRAMRRALSNDWFTEDEPIMGLKFIHEQIQPNRIFRPDGNVNDRIQRIIDGISIENIAFKKYKNGEVHYYGWYNVELYGWGTKEPYKPFRGALDYAESKNPNMVKVTINK